MDNQGFIPHDGLGYHEIEAGTAPVISSNDETTTGDALLARLIYALKDGYLLSASVRWGGSSAFGNRSQVRRVGNECVSTCRSLWSRDHYKTQTVHNKTDATTSQ